MQRCARVCVGGDGHDSAGDVLPPAHVVTPSTQGRERGLTRLRRGFWMDIVTGPHMALGLDCHRPNKFATQLFDIHAKGTGAEQHRHVRGGGGTVLGWGRLGAPPRPPPMPRPPPAHRPPTSRPPPMPRRSPQNAVEVGVYNLLSFMFEMETGRAYRMTRAHDVYSGLGEHEGQERKAPATGTTEGAGEGAAEETKGEGADVAKPDAAAGAAAAEGAVERAKAARRREIDARKRARHITATFSDLKASGPLGWDGMGWVARTGPDRAGPTSRSRPPAVCADRVDGGHDGQGALWSPLSPRVPRVRGGAPPGGRARGWPVRAGRPGDAGNGQVRATAGCPAPPHPCPPIAAPGTWSR